MANQDQKHPQEKSDRALVQSLLQGEKDNLAMAELARLRVRYRGFPGARDIQQDLDRVLSKWQLTENDLFEFTRKLHASGQVYRSKNGPEKQQDWS